MLSRFHLIPERYGQTDRPTDLLYQYRVSVCWRAIKMDPAQCKCKIIRSSTLGVYRSRWVHRLGPQADGPKLPTVYWCTMQFHRELGQKSSFSTMDAMAIFFAFSAHNVTNFPGAPTISNCQFLSIVVFLTANWFQILTTNFFFSNLGGQTPKIYHTQVGVQGGALVRYLGGFNEVFQKIFLITP